MMAPPRQDAKMTDEQTDSLNALLEGYDAEALSDEDAQALVSDIQDLGIKPGSDLSAALSNFGVDARELADQAGIGRGADGDRPPPPSGGRQETQGVGSVDSAAVSLISDAVDAYLSSEDGETTLQAFLEMAMEDAGYDTSQPLINFYA